jgi:hypothetical protein
MFLPTHLTSSSLPAPPCVAAPRSPRRDKLRVAVGVDHGARGLLKLVTDRLLVPTRGDRLVLVRVNPPAVRGQVGDVKGVRSQPGGGMVWVLSPEMIWMHPMLQELQLMPMAHTSARPG